LLPSIAACPSRHRSLATLHILTPEYPPATGGVADYTHLIAQKLTQAGEDVHVWCPPSATSTVPREGTDLFEVHPDLGQFRGADLARVDRLLDRFCSPRRLLVQWVPHGYGFRAMNLRFCYWLWQRARRGDHVELMVHEPYLAFWEGTWRQNAAAVVHRVMTIVLLQAARRVWVAIPAWERKWKPYALGRSVPFTWLPISSGLPLPEPQAVRDVRVRLGASGRPVIGHLGTYGSPVASLLVDALAELLRTLSAPHVLLMGKGSEQFRITFSQRHPQYGHRITAAGSLTDAALAAHVAACDLLIQPYPDGISSRRTTAMAGLHLGVPIVTTSGALTEPFWETSKTVRLSCVGDWATFVDHVDQLLRHPEDRTRLAACAKTFYEGMFDVGLTVAALRTAA
jgi:glycosyltransferase involved in cell wall biosynthesis